MHSNLCLCLLAFSTILIVGQCDENPTTTTVSPVDTNKNDLPDSSSNETKFADANGRSLFEDIPRQGRILNDENISIKGFIPIVGLTSSNENKNTNIQQQLGTTERSPNNYDDGGNFPKYQAGPEDQRYIGAALQGLIGNMSPFNRPNQLLKPQQPPINRKSDCVCVPFYMCRNGFITGSQTGSYNEFPYNVYQQRKTEHYQPMDDSYSPINERSYDNANDTNTSNFAQEILGRMIGRPTSSDKCGLLRTCCQRSYPNQMISNEQFNLEYVPPEIVYGQPLPHQQSIYKPQTNNQYDHQYYQPPNGGYTTTITKPVQIPVQVPVSGIYQQQYRPPKMVNSPSQSMISIDTSLPVPIRNDHIYSGHPITNNHQSIAYQNCGARQSIGINGRVQNLNYHQSSTEFAEFPWQVAILKRIGPSDNLYVCGGALISSSFVLTAAHCIKKFQPQDLKIRLGEWDVHREDEFYPYVEKNVEEIFVHPHFTARNLKNDVALLKLDYEIDLSQHPHISPICMPQPFELFTNQRCYVAGWGKNAFGHQGEYQSVLMKVDLPVLDSKICENLLKHTKLGFGFNLDRSMICAGGEPGKDACEGDGGSGLVCEVNGIWKVVGLVSWGLGCGQANVPGVYTNIGHLRSWIDKIVVPVHANAFVQRQNSANFNELINERSLGATTNGTIANSNANTTTTDQS